MTNDASGTADVRAYLADSEKSQFAGQPIAVGERWQGRDNLLWRCTAGNGGDEVVLKLLLEAGQVRADRQFSGQAIFAPWGLAPRPLWQDRQPDPLPRPIVVYEWIEGDPFDAGDAAAWDAGAGQALGDTVARIHSMDAGEYTRFSPHPFNLAYFWRVWQGSREPLAAWLAERRVGQIQRIFAALWQRVDGLMAAALPYFGESAPALIHGDLLLEHAVLHRGQALLLDWEFFGLGDPAQEVARFFYFDGQALAAQRRAQWLDHYLQAMDNAGAGAESLAARIELYGRVLPFQSLTALLSGIQRELQADPDQLAELDASRPFLVETLVASLRQAAEQLAEPPDADPAALSEEMDRLLALEG